MYKQCAWYGGDGVRLKLDHYDTPRHAITSLLNHHVIKYPVLEPCAGYGSIVNILKLNGHVITTDVDPDMMCDYNLDFLALDLCDEYHSIISNPPFNIAEEIITKSIQDLQDGDEVIMLLKLDFLGTQKRHTFWKTHPAKHIYVLSHRPRFLRHGDRCEYGWYVWKVGWFGNTTLEVVM